MSSNWNEILTSTFHAEMMSPMRDESWDRGYGEGKEEEKVRLGVISGNTDIGENREEKTDRIGSVISIENSVTFTYKYNGFYRLKENMTVRLQR